MRKGGLSATMAALVFAGPKNVGAVKVVWAILTLTLCSTIGATRIRNLWGVIYSSSGLALQPISTNHRLLVWLGSSESFKNVRAARPRTFQHRHSEAM